MTGYAPPSARRQLDASYRRRGHPRHRVGETSRRCKAVATTTRYTFHRSAEESWRTTRSLAPPRTRDSPGPKAGVLSFSEAVVVRYVTPYRRRSARGTSWLARLP